MQRTRATRVCAKNHFFAEQAAGIYSKRDDRRHQRFYPVRGYSRAGCGSGQSGSRARQGRGFKIRMITGASTADECDGVLARANIAIPQPVPTDPTLRNQINAGDAALYGCPSVAYRTTGSRGLFGEMDVALIEVAGITEDGKLIPSLGVGTNVTGCRKRKSYLEVNARQNEKTGGNGRYLRQARLAPFLETYPADRGGRPVSLRLICIAIWEKSPVSF